MTLKVNVNDPRISIPVKRISRCIIGANLVILAKIHFKLLRRQAKFPRILSRNGQNDLKGQGHWPMFLIPNKSTSWCMFGANLVIPVKICDELLWGQAEIPIILSKNGQMTLKIKINDPYFQYQTRISQDARLVQIWWFQPKSVMSYCADKPNFLEF